MKNISKIGLSALFLSALVLAGCGNKNTANTGTPEQNSSASNTASSADSSQSLTDTVKQSLYDLMTTGTGVKCTIEDPRMGQLTMYAMGDKAKVEGFSFMAGMSNPSAPGGEQPKEEKGTMINDSTWAYMWSGKEGMKFNIEEMKTLAPKNQNQNQNGDNSQADASNWKDWVKKMDADGTKYDCGPAVLSDADFTPPSDVKFQDWGEMMKGFQKMGQDMKDKMPSQPPPLPSP